MPGNTYYWNSAEFDSDESVSNTFRKSYVDPWDLENYAYIRNHLDSLELNSNASSFGEPVEASSFYYAPVQNETYDPSLEKKNYDSLIESEYGTAKYAEIDEVFEENIKPGLEEELYGVRSLGLHNEDDTKTKRSSSTTAYDHLQQPKVMKRRMSYSFGDQEHGSFHPPRIGYLTSNDKKKTNQPPTIIEELANSFQPNNFGLSNYGHLKIDYSCSWDNLNKYISN